MLPATRPNRVGPTTPAPGRFRITGPTNQTGRRSWEKYKRRSAEREIGYGNLDDWNALPEADQARIRGHSKKLQNSFRFTRWFLQLLGIFPFKTKSLEDGSMTFQMSRCSISFVIFFITTVLCTGIFVLFTVGFISIFVATSNGRTFHDRCGKTWGKAVISRNLPGIIFVWNQMLVTTMGNIYVLTHSHKFLKFYNVVNEAVMQIDVDPTHGMKASDIRGSIMFVFILILCIGLFVTESLHSLEEVPLFVIQCVLYFFIKDIHHDIGHHKPFTAVDYEDLLLKCDNDCKGCYDDLRHDSERCINNKCYNVVNSPTQELQLFKWIGFFVIAYSTMCSRGLIRQFEFFCQVMVNLASVWNKRFVNYASKDNKIVMEDPYKRRITNQHMLKDHYEIVRLYNETENNFSVILFLYFTTVFFSLITQFYFTALLNSQVTCAEAVQRERTAAFAGLCYVNPTQGINNTDDVIKSGLIEVTSDGFPIWKFILSFEDACSLPQEKIIQHALITTVVLLVITMTSFFMTTLEADRASHQADIGFYRVRRRGYMSCTTKMQRNTMHSLVFSFTGPKPFCMSAAGYFPIRKKTVVVLTSVAFIYFLIILSYKPGVNKGYVRCYTFNGGTQRFVVQYPPVI